MLFILSKVKFTRGTKLAFYGIRIATKGEGKGNYLVIAFGLLCRADVAGRLGRELPSDVYAPLPKP